MSVVEDHQLGSDPGSGPESGPAWEPPPPPWAQPPTPSGEPPQPPPSRGTSPALLALLFVVALVFGVVGGAMWRGYAKPSVSTTAATTPADASSGSGSSSAGVANIAAAVAPEIVNINTTLGFENAQAAGTGIVITSSGEVLTNNHVIEGATSIKATDLGNGKTYTAKVVGYDATHDLAVLQLVGASNLKTAKLATAAVRVDDPVIALGNAGGTGGAPSVSTGTVTDVDASITASDPSDGTSEDLTGLIQTNAALQPRFRIVSFEYDTPVCNPEVLCSCTTCSSKYTCARPFGTRHDDGTNDQIP